MKTSKLAVVFMPLCQPQLFFDDFTKINALQSFSDNENMFSQSPQINRLSSFNGHHKAVRKPRKGDNQLT